MDRYSINTATT